MTEKKILGVFAYWQNDKPGGIGVGFDFARHNEDAGVGFAHFVHDHLAHWDRIPAKDIFEQLRLIGEMPEKDRKEEDRFLAFMDIYWLEQRKHLKADEYNGVIWAWVPPGMHAIGMSEQNPVTIGTWEQFDVTLAVNAAVESGDHTTLQMVLDALRAGKPS